MMNKIDAYNYLAISAKLSIQTVYMLSKANQLIVDDKHSNSFSKGTASKKEPFKWWQRNSEGFCATHYLKNFWMGSSLSGNAFLSYLQKCPSILQ